MDTEGEAPSAEPMSAWQFGQAEHWQVYRWHKDSAAFKFAEAYSAHANAALLQLVKELETHVTHLQKYFDREHGRAETAERRVEELEETLKKHDVCPKCYGRFSSKHCFTSRSQPFP